MYQNVYMPVTSLDAGPVKAGGACSIKYFRHQDVLAWPDIDPLTGVMVNSIQLKPGAFLYLCGSIPQTRVFTEEQRKTTAGPHYDITASGSLEGSKAAQILALGTMIHNKWGLIVTDKNGVTRLIGNEDTGADLLFDYTSGQTNSSRKTELTWKWQHSQPAPVYTAAAFDITIGGEVVTAGSLQLIIRFEVGAPGAPMDEGDTTLTNAGFANKYLMVIASSLVLPTDDGSGSIDWSSSIARHIEKTLPSNTITFIGGVVDEEIIEIYAFS